MRARLLVLVTLSLVCMPSNIRMQAATALAQSPAASESIATSPSPRKQDVPKATKDSAQERRTEWRGWEADVWAPIVRLAAIAFILGALIWWLDLRSVLQGAAWSERTIVAFAIVFTFCAATLMGVTSDVMGVLKDVAIMVLAFYFGVSKGDREGAARPAATDKPGTPKPDQAGQAPPADKK